MYPYVDGARQLMVVPEPAEVEPPEGVSAIHFAPRRAHTAEEFPSGGAGMAEGASDILKVLEVVWKDGTGFIDART